MSYVSVAEADDRLTDSAVWASLTDEAKSNHLLTAALWLNYSYQWPGKIAACPVDPTPVLDGFPYTFPITLGSGGVRSLVNPVWPRVACDGSTLTTCDGCELIGVPHEVKMANIFAAEASASIPLFAVPTVDEGSLTRKLIKAGPVTIDKTWADASRGSGGEVLLPKVDALLMGIGTRKGSVTGRIPLAF